MFSHLYKCKRVCSPACVRRGGWWERTCAPRLLSSLTTIIFAQGNTPRLNQLSPSKLIWKQEGQLFQLGNKKPVSWGRFSVFSRLLGPSSVLETAGRKVQTVTLCFGISCLLSDRKGCSWHIWHINAFRHDLGNLWLNLFQSTEASDHFQLWIISSALQ